MDPGDTYEFDPTERRGLTYKRISAGEYAPWGYEVSTLWEVPGASRMLTSKSPAEQRLIDAGGCYYGFDWRAAEADISRSSQAQNQELRDRLSDLDERAQALLGEFGPEIGSPEDHPAVVTQERNEADQMAIVALRPNEGGKGDPSMGSSIDPDMGSNIEPT